VFLGDFGRRHSLKNNEKASDGDEVSLVSLPAVYMKKRGNSNFVLETHTSRCSRPKVTKRKVHCAYQSVDHSVFVN